MFTDTQRAAFFDVDNTLLDVKSMFSFQSFYLDTWLPGRLVHAESFSQFSSRLAREPNRHDRQFLNRLFYESYAGHSRRSMSDAAVAWFDQLTAQRGGGLWIESALELAEKLRRQGYLLVAVSGSSHEILSPIIKHLVFDACLATHLEAHESHDDCLTGRILAPQMIGAGKQTAVREWALGRGVDLEQSVACGDHITDLPMLECVGIPHIVTGDDALEKIAGSRGWPILRSTPGDDMFMMHT